MSAENEITHWQIDRRIPIALLVTLFLQIAIAIIWTTQLNARVDTLEQKADYSSDFGEKLARIDERLQAVKQYMEDIRQEIRSVNGRLAK